MKSKKSKKCLLPRKLYVRSALRRKIPKTTVIQKISYQKNSSHRAEHQSTLFGILAINYTPFIGVRLLRGLTIPGAVSRKRVKRFLKFFDMLFSSIS